MTFDFLKFSTKLTYRGLAATSRERLDVAAKPCDAVVIAQLSTGPSWHFAIGCEILSLCFRRVFFLGLLFSSLSLYSQNAASSTEPLKEPIKGSVFTMRGGLVGVFSTGMLTLANTLQSDYHIFSASTAYHNSAGLSSFIIKQYRAGKLNKPIILVGHSLGANEQINVAHHLALANIPVRLLITLDAGLPIKVSDNVKEVLNLYQPTMSPIFKSIPLVAVDPKRTYINNYNVATIKKIHVNHFTDSENTEIQKIMLDKILFALRSK